MKVLKIISIAVYSFCLVMPAHALNGQFDNNIFISSLDSESSGSEVGGEGGGGEGGGGFGSDSDS